MNHIIITDSSSGKSINISIIIIEKDYFDKNK